MKVEKGNDINQIEQKFWLICFKRMAMSPSYNPPTPPFRGKLESQSGPSKGEELL